MRISFLSFIAVVLSWSFISCNQSAPPKEETGKAQPKADSGQRLAKNYLTDCKKLFAEAWHSDSILLTQLEVDMKSANKAIKDFTDFAYYCQGDSMSPIYLVKTAQVAKAINNIPQAKAVLDKCIADYPRFRGRPAALFLLAQLYDEPGYLNDEQEAGKLYQKIIDEHPKSDWALSAKGAISMLGKSDAQIMQELKKKK